MTKTFTDIDIKALDELIKRVQEAITHDLALAPEGLSVDPGCIVNVH
ncbi:MAG: hypothetical protein HRT37_21665 [Alteromonadaceae bacterium]|nr:hypothetical protein [Alteromonadaceae bacterium]